MSREKTGGPAFPRPTSTDEHIEPCNVEIAQAGMHAAEQQICERLAQILNGD